MKVDDPMPKAMILLTALLLGTMWPSPTMAARCDTDAVPAATLLFPYFQVDLDAPNGRTTLFAITNNGPEPVLTNVVLWTDWAIPTLQFNVYLAGFDVQSVNLRDVIVHGRLPTTGSAISHHGDLSGAPRAFPECNLSAEPGAAPVYPQPALNQAERDELAAFHAGRCFAGRRASAHTGNLARGYVTVDVVGRCAELTPADAGYFGESRVARHDNVLSGDYFLIDSDESFAQGELAVHVESFPAEFSAGDYTFYKRYVGGSGIDGREPLGTQYSLRHLSGGAFDGGTSVLVWRDTGTPEAEPVFCDGSLSWQQTCGGLSSYRVFFDESSSAEKDVFEASPSVILGACDPPFAAPFATQLVAVNDTPAALERTFSTSFDFGRTYITTRNLRGAEDPAEWEILQGWVSVMNSAENRYSVGQRAIRLDSACAPAPIVPAPSDFD